MTATQVVQASLRDDTSVDELVRLAEGDPGFALRLLAVVNSAAFGMKHRVTDVRQAGSLLGVRGLRNVGLSLALSEMIPPDKEATILLANCLRRAVACRVLAEKQGSLQKDELFTVGLFLEVGILTLARKEPAVAIALARAPALYRCVSERADGRIPHPIRGAELAQLFKLPERTLSAIRRHHDLHMPDEPFARTAWVAERVAAAFEGGDPVATRNDALNALTSAGISRADADALLHELPKLVTDAASGFARDISPQPDLKTLAADAQRALVALNLDYERLVRKLESLISEKEQLAEQLRSANERLVELAASDALTGLPNKRAFDDALKREVSRSLRHASPLSLIMIDVDHFKLINDTYGHPIGDQVLRELAHMLRANLRTGDLAARYGGEEFVILLPEANLDGGLVVAERLRRAIEAQVLRLNESELRFTASLGVAEFHKTSNAADLVARADGALYAAKRSGRNRVQCAGPLLEPVISQPAAPRLSAF